MYNANSDDHSAGFGDFRPALLMGASVAALGGLLFGFDTVVIAGANKGLVATYDLSPLSLGITVSSALFGTILGAAGAKIPADRLGRKPALLLVAVIYLLSALGCAFAWNWYAFLCFRIIGGVGIGGSSVLGPMYIAEISPPKWRGRLAGAFQFNICAGALLAYFSNYLIGLYSLGAVEWRWKLGVSALPALAFCLLVFWIRESPRWLVKAGRNQEAAKVLESLTQQNSALLLEQLRTAKQPSKRPRLFTMKYALPIFLAISIGFFNQMSGVNAILYYINDIFARAGFSANSGNIQAVCVGAANLLATTLGVSVIDKLGRKILLLIGAVGTAICLSGVALVFLTNTHINLLVWLLMGFISFSSFSQGAVIWVYLSEVFPTDVRAAGASVGSMSHWVMNALVSGTFPVLAARSSGLPFVFFAGMMVAQFVVVLVYYPETKGLSLEQIESVIQTVPLE
jgi:sugar porter (SP) family MFS transporter